MSTKKDGGPAFPDDDSTPTNIHAFPVMQVLVEDGKVQFMQRATGMSLRDYFAAKAMQGLLAEPNSQDFLSTIEALTPDWRKEGQVPGARVAVAAYVVADSLLKAREQ